MSLVTSVSDPPATFELEEFDEWLATFPSLEANNSIPDKDGCTLQEIRNRTSPVAAVHRPLPPSQGKRKRTTASNYQQEADRAYDDDARRIHILSERERRRTMNGLFSKLASLLPESSAKSDKCVIVEEIISYIQALENELKELSKKREEVMKTGSVSPLKKPDITMKLGNSGSARDGNRSLGSSQAPNAVLNTCRRHVFVTMCSSKSIANVLSTAIAITEQHKLIILDANMSSNESMAFLYLHLEARDENMLVFKDALQTQLPDLTNICFHQAP